MELAFPPPTPTHTLFHCPLKPYYSFIISFMGHQNHVKISIFGTISQEAGRQNSEYINNETHLFYFYVKFLKKSVNFFLPLPCPSPLATPPTYVNCTISNTRATCTFAYHSFCDNLRLQCTSQTSV